MNNAYRMEVIRIINSLLDAIEDLEITAGRIEFLKDEVYKDYEDNLLEEVTMLIDCLESAHNLIGTYQIEEAISDLREAIEM